MKADPNQLHLTAKPVATGQMTMDSLGDWFGQPAATPMILEEEPDQWPHLQIVRDVIEQDRKPVDKLAEKRAAYFEAMKAWKYADGYAGPVTELLDSLMANPAMTAKHIDQAIKEILSEPRQRNFTPVVL